MTKDGIIIVHCKAFLCKVFYYLYNLGSSSKYSFQTNESMSGVGSTIGASFGGAVYTVAETIDAFKLDDWGLGYGIWGTFKLYGVKQI